MMHHPSSPAGAAVVARTDTPIRVEREAVAQIEALRQRSPAAWTNLYDRHSGLIFRSALAQVGDRTLAEDITAQVFMEAIEGIGRYRDRGRPIEAWLLTIARHRSIDAARRRKREAAILAAVTTARQGPSSGPALEALADLTADQRQVIHLRFVEDLSIEQVARLTKRSPGAVKSLQHRALRQLRARLESNFPGGNSHA